MQTQWKQHEFLYYKHVLVYIILIFFQLFWPTWIDVSLWVIWLALKRTVFFSYVSAQHGYCCLMQTSNAASLCWSPLWRTCHTNSRRYVSNSCLVVPNWRRNLRFARIQRFSTFWVCISGCSGSTKFSWWTTTSWRYTPPFSCERLL